MNAAAVANVARSVWGDLREKRLWPLALVLIVAVIAVPVLLMHSAAPTTPPAPLTASASAPPGVPAVGVPNAPGHENLPGNGRDPFGHSPGATGAASATGASTTGSATSGSAAAHGASTGSGNTSGAGGSSTAGSGSTTPATVVSTPAPAGGAPPPPLPARKPAPAPTGLSSLQAYQVSLSITDASGGLNRVDSLERLGILPNARQPLLVELGVLQGGKRVVFVVAPGTVLRGPGACVPGPLDCEILTLAPNQIEAVAANVSSGAAAMFAITDITAADYPSKAAADQARQAEFLAGRQFLNQLPLQALQLFPYDESLGAVVDLRNLTVGG
jgi:hypothetical protein